MLETIIIIVLFLGLVSLITSVINFFRGVDTSNKEESEDAELNGKLYSELNIDLITKEVGQEEEIYHLKGLVDGVNYDIQVLKSEYEKKKRYYENVNKSP